MPQWEARAAEEAGAAGLEALSRATPDGLLLKPLYSVEDRPRTEWMPLPIRRRGPTLCSVVEASDPGVAGEQLGEELAGGAEGVWLRLDRTTRLGLDPVLPDSWAAADGEERSADGVPVHHGSDLALVLRGLANDQPGTGCELWLDAGANFLPWAALWLADCQRRGRDPSLSTVHFGADPLAALAGDGALPRDLMKLSSEMAALARFCGGRLAGSSAIGVSTVAYHEAGANPAQELGFMVATWLDYVRRLGDSGLPADEVAPLTSLRIAVGPQVFPEIAKLRAARYLWIAAVRAAGVEDPPAARLHVVGSRRALAARAVELNLLRGCEQALAAFCGEADAVSVWGFDRVLGPSGSRARRLARNTPLILRHEGGLDRVEDPAAGSFLVESLTRRLAQEGWTLAQDIERRGGMSRCLLSGEVGRLVAASSEARSRAFATSRASVTGVTDFVLDQEAEPPPSRFSVATAAAEARHRLDRHRASWTVEGEDVSYSRDFVVEELLLRARRGDTLRELGARLGGRQGSESIEVLVCQRDAAPFEEPVDSDVSSAAGSEEE